MNTLRSVARYVALALGEEWEVRIAADEGSFERPFARVVAATPLQSSPIGAHHIECRQTFSVVAFPVEGMNAESSQVEAARIERLLLLALVKGIDQELFSRRRAHPMRVPLFDYSAVGLYDAAPDDARIGVLRVIEPPTVESFPDPNSEDAYGVVASLRMMWTEGVGVPSTSPLVQSVKAEVV